MGPGFPNTLCWSCPGEMSRAGAYMGWGVLSHSLGHSGETAGGGGDAALVGCLEMEWEQVQSIGSWVVLHLSYHGRMAGP